MPDEVYEAWPDYDIRHEDRSWIPEFCGKCHSDPVFMRGYAPSLPTDQVAKYRTSRHGILLLQKGDNGVAQCVSCHGVHGILGPDSRNSKVHPQAIPETCGHCHSDKKLMAGRKLADGSPMPTNQLAQYRESVHGRALLEKGDLGAPACNDCHGNHAAMPPAVSHVSQVCRTCHALNGKLFDGSNHKRAFEEHKWPECETCHGKHDISKTSDAMLGTAPGDLCYDCHTKYSSKKDECIRTADHFHETIDKMAAAEDLFTEKGEWMAEHGLDNQSLEEVRANLHDALRTSRTTIHAFDRSDFDEAAQAGLAAVKKGDELLAKGHEEFTFRRKGLIIALLVMVFLAVVLAMKIRQIERHS
jgi:predicted CXXCH cytochrome family protein